MDLTGNVVSPASLKAYAVDYRSVIQGWGVKKFE